MLKFALWIDSLTERLGAAAALAVILTVTVGFYNVMARYIGKYIGFKLTSNLMIELQWYLFSITFLLGFAFILKHGDNVRVDFFYGDWSPKAKAWVNLIGHALFLTTFCIIGIYVVAPEVMKSWGLLPDGTFGTWELSPDPNGLPRAPIKSMMIVGLALLFAQAVSEVIKNAARIRGIPVPGDEDPVETA